MLKQAGFDAWLFRNTEGALYFFEHGLTKETPFVTDHSLYVWNREAEKILLEMLGTAPVGLTLPLELSGKELEQLAAQLRTPAPGSQLSPGSQAADAGSQHSPGPQPQLELVVYGRAPMMVSAQCLKKTSGGCRKGEEELLFLRDRTGARMPVRNYCRFCYNIIYNAVPTVLYDLDRELGRISPQAYRYEFSTESAAETFAVLEGRAPDRAGASAGFTRGHLHRGV
jgi:putative protease